MREVLARVLVLEHLEIRIVVADAPADKPLLVQNHERAHGGNQSEIPGSELSALYQQRIFYVLLNKAVLPELLVPGIILPALHLPDNLLHRINPLVYRDPDSQRAVRILRHPDALLLPVEELLLLRIVRWLAQVEQNCFRVEDVRGIARVQLSRIELSQRDGQLVLEAEQISQVLDVIYDLFPLFKVLVVVLVPVFSLGRLFFEVSANAGKGGACAGGPELKEKEEQTCACV